jgi:YidC/Oxa1 family membrane protein insertase
MPEYKSPQQEPGTERRFLLVFLLIAVVIFGSQLLMKKFMPQQPPSTAKPVQQPIQVPAAQAPGAAQPQSAVGQSNAGGGARATKSAQPATTKQAQSETETVIENDLYRITFTNRGAQVKSWVLKKFQDDQGRPLDLVNPIAAPKYGYPLSLWTYDETLRNKLNSAMYVGSEEGNLTAPATLSFEYSDAGLTVRKFCSFQRRSGKRVSCVASGIRRPDYSPGICGHPIRVPGQQQHRTYPRQESFWRQYPSRHFRLGWNS